MILLAARRVPRCASGALGGALARRFGTGSDGHEQIPPGVITRPAHVVSMISQPAPPDDPATLISRITQDLASLKKALTERPIPPALAPVQPKLMLTVEEAGELIGVSRTVMYDLIGDGSIQSVKIGSLRRVPRTALDAYVAGLTAHQAAW